MLLLAFQHVTLSREGRTILAGLHFALAPGQLVCITGENGAGKTTLLEAALGLFAPSAGQIVRSPALALGGIGYVPQHSTAMQALPATVREIVLSGRLGHLGRRPFYRAADKAAADAQLAALGLAPLAQRPFPALSGGQQRRVLLARALCAAGQLLLLDEPLAGLDAASAQALWAQLRTYTKAGGAVLMVTHDLAGAAAHADRVLQLGSGCQLRFGPGKGGLCT